MRLGLQRCPRLSWARLLAQDGRCCDAAGVAALPAFELGQAACWQQPLGPLGRRGARAARAARAAPTRQGFGLEAPGPQAAEDTGPRGASPGPGRKGQRQKQTQANP